MHRPRKHGGKGFRRVHNGPVTNPKDFRRMQREDFHGRSVNVPPPGFAPRGPMPRPYRGGVTGCLPAMLISLMIIGICLFIVF